jgi:nucleoside 2-deoxyribosyltransferase
MGLKIYTAGSISRRPEIKEAASDLRGEGYIVTSRWLDEIGPNLAFANYPVDLKQRNAIRDLEDILKADVLLHFADGYGHQGRGGGRHFEAGYAWANQKPIIVYGAADHLFHFLPGVRIVSGWNDVWLALDDLARERSDATTWTEKNVEHVYDVS